MMDQTQGWWMAGLPGLKTDMKGGEEEAKGLPFVAVYAGDMRGALCL